MCRIVINTDQLVETAAVLQSAAGEYQAIGANVAGCDCGCMPADVAAVVDTVTAAVRSVLQSVAADLATQALALGWRADVDQDGGFQGVDAAWSDPGTSTMTIGGYDTSVFGGSTGGTTLVIGGTDSSPFVTPVGASTITIGGYGGHYFDGDEGGSPIILGGTDPGYGTPFTIGGTDGTTGGTLLTIPGTYYDPSATLPSTGDLFWDNPEAWLESLRPASQAWANSGFMLNIPGVSMANALGHWGNVGLNAISSGGEYRWNNYEGANYWVPTGDLAGTRV
jgi:hypothetical protein